MANPSDMRNGGEGDPTTVVPSDSITIQQKGFIGAALALCMLGIVLIVVSIHRSLRDRRRREEAMGTDIHHHSTSFDPWYLRNTYGSPFSTLTERRRRERAVKKRPSVTSVPIKIHQKDELVHWHKFQPVCAQVKDADEKSSVYEVKTASRSTASVETSRSQPGNGLTVGAIIMMPTARSSHSANSMPAVQLPMMLGTAEVRES